MPLSRRFFPPPARFPPPAGRRMRMAGVAGAGSAALLAELAAACGRHILFIARDSLDADHTAEEAAFFAPRLPLRRLPDWDVLPYDAFSPTAEVVSMRITALAGLLDDKPGLTVTTPAAMLLPAPPPAFIAARSFDLRVGDILPPAALTRRLRQGRYERVDRVLAPGEFAVYGGQADVFPPNTETPFRLVFSGDEIEQIRLFNPETQRSSARARHFRVLPMSECDLSEEGVAAFRRAFGEAFAGADARICRDLAASGSAPGMEFFLPLFFGGCARVFDYLGDSCVIVARHGIADAAGDFLRQARQREEIAGVYEGRPLIPAARLFLGGEEFFARMKKFSLLQLDAPPAESSPPPVAFNARAADPYERLSAFAAGFDGRVIIAADAAGRRDSLAALLKGARVCETFEECLSSPLSLTAAPLRAGWTMPGLAVLTEAEIFDAPPAPRARRAAGAGAANVLLPDEIRAGDLVVHREYGVGRARGLKNLVVDGAAGEFFEIEYADEQRLWLPVSRLHLLERHQGGAELSKMGGAAWRRARRRAERRAYDAAARMLEINARRAAGKPRRHKPDDVLLAKFVAGFAHAETPDQARAAAEVLDDLRAARLMDRLIIADVGFGKTEIAMRAAAAAVFGGAQAAVLAPTTLLAEQHYRVFTDRFAGFPARVDCLTRLTPESRRRRALEALARGETDIIVGTHALLQKSVRYKNLGLAVIDEEHRFGVRHKEMFKAMRADADLLAMSATPIPRTLAMALGGVRDMSLISTPPASRLPVKTINAPFSRAVVVEACERELRRGGQVFFIHNEIRGLPEMAETLAACLPRARVLTVHGGMAARDMEGAMRRFLRREADILLCTTIVESGLDIANANTIVINRADRMGLARLHQLRGRVGRAGAQAYAYFLTPADFDASKRAQMRLSAAGDYADLGGGFSMSMRDLEIRGAGEILGEKQSGDMEAVGCASYQRMINAAARQLRGQPEANADAAAVTLPAPALLPAEYVPSPNERMRYYRRLGAAENEEEISAIVDEWEDRFGAPPPPALLLGESHRLRLAAQAAAVKEVRAGKDGRAVLHFAPAPPCAARLLEKIAAGECAPSSPSSVRLQLQSEDAVEQAQKILKFLQSLSGAGAVAA